MPIVAIPIEMLTDRLGEPKLDAESLVGYLQRLGCDLDGHERVEQFRCDRCGTLTETGPGGQRPLTCEGCGADFKERPELLVQAGEVEVVRIDLLPVRPDMLDPGGLARALRSFLGRAEGPPEYGCLPPRLSVEVDPGMTDRSSYRPYIACAVVRDIPLDGKLIPVVMKLQENLHWAMGRDRKLASIGVYDLATIAGPTLRFRPVGPKEMRFVPLMCDPSDPASNMTPRQVLESHPKGVAYAHLLAKHRAYPLLEDGRGQVLSMPPIINSEATKVTETTTDLFIDVTGLSERLVQKTLVVTVTSLLELSASARLEQVKVIYPDREVVTPDLAPDVHRLDPARAARLIGIDLDRAGAAKLLTQMGHRVAELVDGSLRVEVPAYRNDVLHEVDLIEDVAMGYGYHEVVPTLVESMTVGLPREIEERSGVARQILAGLGLLEVVTLPLTCPEACYDALGLPRGDDAVTIANPVSIEQTMLRTSLMPGLLGVLANNIHHELPQRIFEVSDITRLDPEAETGARERRMVAVALIGGRVGLAEARSVAQALLRELGWELIVTADDQITSDLWIPGRATSLSARQGDRTLAVGLMGEVYPAVLERFGLRAAAALLEVDLQILD
jgi:phenylalanyl-tRNA synthetase beta chain